MTNAKLVRLGNSESETLGKGSSLLLNITHNETDFAQSDLGIYHPKDFLAMWSHTL